MMEWFVWLLSRHLWKTTSLLQSSTTETEKDFHRTILICFCFNFRDLSATIDPFRQLYTFQDSHELKYGQLILPRLTNNFGPMYFCKITRRCQNYQIKIPKILIQNFFYEYFYWVGFFSSYQMLSQYDSIYIFSSTIWTIPISSFCCLVYETKRHQKGN